MKRPAWVAALAIAVLSLSLCGCRTVRGPGYWDSEGFHALKPLSSAVERGRP